MDLCKFTRARNMTFGSRREWHTFARALLEKGIVQRYDKKITSGRDTRIVDGYRILDLEGLQRFISPRLVSC